MDVAGEGGHHKARVARKRHWGVICMDTSAATTSMDISAVTTSAATTCAVASAVLCFLGGRGTVLPASPPEHYGTSVNQSVNQRV